MTVSTSRSEPGPGGFTAAVARRLKGSLEGWAVVHIEGGQLCLSGEKFHLHPPLPVHLWIVQPVKPKVFTACLSREKGFRPLFRLPAIDVLDNGPAMAAQPQRPRTARLSLLRG